MKVQKRSWQKLFQEPEEDPEERVDRVADEVEEKRPEGAEGNSFLTTRNVYDWRKKSYHHEDGATSIRWERRSRLVASEVAFAEGKRDDTFSPATSGHVLRLLSTNSCRGSVRRKKQEREKEHFTKC